jgi:hypothetical protein
LPLFTLIKSGRSRLLVVFLLREARSFTSRFEANASQIMKTIIITAVREMKEQ